MKKNKFSAQTLTFTLLVTAAIFCFGRQGLAANDSQACAKDAEIRELDYWLGDWTMGSGADKSTSKVSLSLEQCMFVEHWENSKGHVTQKMFAYSLEEKNWSGMFADNEGRVHVFLNGKVSAQKAEFGGPSRGANGEAVLNRLSVIRVSPDRVQEIWEKSTDNGATWTTAYRADYTRTNRWK
jgi:hypothetical protein